MTYDTDYMAKRRSAAVGRGDCMICCKRPKLPDRVRCGVCNELQRRANRAVYRAAHRPYEPLDEILSSPRVRVLRKLRWLDWTTTLTALDDLDVPSDERKKYIAALSHALKMGQLEARATGGTKEYRITQAGKAALRELAADYDKRLGEGVAA